MQNLIHFWRYKLENLCKYLLKCVFLLVCFFFLLPVLLLKAEEVPAEEVCNLFPDPTQDTLIVSSNIKAEENYYDNCIYKTIHIVEGGSIEFGLTTVYLSLTNFITDSTVNELDLQGSTLKSKFVTFEGDMKVSIVSSGRFEVGQAGLYPPDPECSGSSDECGDKTIGFLEFKGDNLTFDIGTKENISTGVVLVNVKLFNDVCDVDDLECLNQKKSMTINNYGGAVTYLSYCEVYGLADDGVTLNQDKCKVFDSININNQSNGSVEIDLWACNLNEKNTTASGYCDKSRYTNTTMMDVLDIYATSGTVSFITGLGFFAKENYLFVGATASIECSTIDVECQTKYLEANDNPDLDGRQTFLHATIKGTFSGMLNATLGNDEVNLYDGARVLGAKNTSGEECNPDGTNSNTCNPDYGKKQDINLLDGDDVLGLYSYLKKYPEDETYVVLEMNMLVDGGEGNDVINVYGRVMFSDNNGKSIFSNFEKSVWDKNTEVTFKNASAASETFKEIDVVNNGGYLNITYDYNVKFKSYEQNGGKISLYFDLFNTENRSSIEATDYMKFNNVVFEVDTATKDEKDIEYVKLYLDEDYVITSANVEEFNNNNIVHVSDPRIVGEFIYENETVAIDFTLNDYNQRVNSYTENEEVILIANSLNSVLYSKEYQDMFNVFDKLNYLSGNDLVNAVDDMTPYYMEDIKQMNISITVNINNMINKRNTDFGFTHNNKIHGTKNIKTIGDDLKIQNIVLWTGVDFSKTFYDDSNYKKQTNLQNNIYAMGADFILTDRLLMGIAFFYGDSSIDSNSIYYGGVQAYNYAVYIQYNPKFLYTNSILSYGMNRFKIKRYDSYIDESTKAMFYSDVLNFNYEMGKKFALFNKNSPTEYIIDFYTGLNYIDIKTPEFTESGEMGYVYDDTEGKSFAYYFGTRISREFKVSYLYKKTIEPNLDFKLGYNKSDNIDTVVKFNSDNADTMVFKSENYSGMFFYINGGVSYKIAKNFKADLGLSMYKTEKISNGALNIKLKFIL